MLSTEQTIKKFRTLGANDRAKVIAGALSYWANDYFNNDVLPEEVKLPKMGAEKLTLEDLIELIYSIGDNIEFYLMQGLCLHV
jgi:hypothetical protein